MNSKKKIVGIVIATSDYKGYLIKIKNCLINYQKTLERFMC